MRRIIPQLHLKPNSIFYLLLIGLAVVFLFLTLGSILGGHLSLTYDEPQHYRYGELILNGISDRFDDSKMPVSVINVIPSKLLEQFFGSIFTNSWQVMSSGRIATIFISLLLAVSVLLVGEIVIWQVGLA